MQSETDSAAEAAPDSVSPLIAATPPDLLWRALFGFQADDAVFGEDTARMVAALVGDKAAEGLPVACADELVWKLPERLPAGAGSALSVVLQRALDLAAADAVAEEAAEEESVDPFDLVGDGVPAQADDAQLSRSLRLLLEMPDWWTAPKCPVVLANLPDEGRWHVAARGFGTDLLMWRARRAVDEGLTSGEAPGVPSLDGPASAPFRAVLGPAPAGYLHRMEMAKREPYFARSAAGFLAAAAADALDRLPGRMSGSDDGASWKWCGGTRDGLRSACHRLSGSMLGALAERIVIAGPFEPGVGGRAAAVTFVRTTMPSESDPMALFMKAAMAGEAVPGSKP